MDNKKTIFFSSPISNSFHWRLVQAFAAGPCPIIQLHLHPHLSECTHPVPWRCPALDQVREDASGNQPAVGCFFGINNHKPFTEVIRRKTKTIHGSGSAQFFSRRLQAAWRISNSLYFKSTPKYWEGQFYYINL